MMGAEIVPFYSTPRKGVSARVGWIVDENGCHIWQGWKSSNGYGMLRVHGKNQRVHRLRYEREVGPIPEGLVLDHFVCDNRECCNPAHVRPVSQRENVLRGAAPTAQNAAKTHCPQGHPYEGENLRVGRQGWRYCRACTKRARRRVGAVMSES